MRGKFRAVVAAVAVMLSLATAVSAQAGGRVTLTSRTMLNGKSVSGSFSGSLGRGSVTGRADLPFFYLTFHNGRSSATMKFKGAPNSAGKITGRWTWASGSGKFSHIKGSGTGVGTPVGKGYKTVVFTFSGS